MFVLRRASNPLRNVGYTLGISHAYCSKFVNPEGIESQTGTLKSPQDDGCLSVERFCSFMDFFSFKVRGISSQEKDNSHDGVFDLELPATAEISEEGNAIEVLGLEAELLDDDGTNEDPYSYELGLLNHETNTSDTKSSSKGNSELLVVILSDIPSPVRCALDKWIAEGKQLGREEIFFVIHNLRQRGVFGKALQVLEWVEANKRLDFVETDYASRLDLIAKLYGLRKAEGYIRDVPESFRGEVLYRTLLSNCVAVSNNVQKVEELFNQMRDLGFPLTSFVCNRMLLLYRKFDEKKLDGLLTLMENEKVKPNPITYSILLDIKGQADDITGMDEILETMKAQGVEPCTRSQAILASHYIRCGIKEKAESILKQMEGGNLEDHRSVCRLLLPLYAALGKADEVERVWKVCEPNPQYWECAAAIQAWGKLNRIEKAEEIFHRMPKTSKWKSAKIYTALLKVYSEANGLRWVWNRPVTIGCIRETACGSWKGGKG